MKLNKGEMFCTYSNTKHFSPCECPQWLTAEGSGVYVEESVAKNADKDQVKIISRFKIVPLD